MKKWNIFMIVSVFMLLMTACNADGQQSESDGQDAEMITIEHEYGSTPVKKNPEKVVVFDFGVLDTLDELGVDVVGLPQATIPNYLEKYSSQEYTNVGSLKEPDFETIHSLNPDVIFISTRQAELYDEFAKIAPTIYVGMDYVDYMDSFEANMELIASIFDKDEQMKAEMEEIHSRIQKVKDETEKEDFDTLVIMGNEGKVSAYGPSSRFGLIHDVFGFKAVDQHIEESTHGQNISFEYILEQNPDILFVIDRDAAFSDNGSVKDYVENDLVNRTKAYQNDRIIYLDAGYWYLSGGGLQSMKKMIESLETLY